MKKAKIFISIIVLSLLIVSQAAVAFAAPKLEGMALITGKPVVVTKEIDLSTGIITFVVTVEDDLGGKQTVRISEETAWDLGLIDYDVDGHPFIFDTLPTYVEIDPTTVIPSGEEPQHPVANALATFFSDIDGLDYDAIMQAHEDGTGFGVIAQALWLTRKLAGEQADTQLFLDILQARKDGDFTGFTFDDGSSPGNWGQFRQAVMGEDKKGSLGIAKSEKDKDEKDIPNGGNSGNANNINSNKDRNKDKSNNGHGSGNGNGHGNRP